MQVRVPTLKSDELGSNYIFSVIGYLTSLNLIYKIKKAKASTS